MLPLLKPKPLISKHKTHLRTPSGWRLPALRSTPRRWSRLKAKTHIKMRSGAVYQTELRSTLRMTPWLKGGLILPRPPRPPSRLWAWKPKALPLRLKPTACRWRRFTVRS